MIFQDLPYGFSIVTFAPMIFSLVVSILVAVFIYKDAQKRGIEPTLYIFLTCCCSLCIGGIIYLIVASNHPIQTDDYQQPSFGSNQGQVYGQQQHTIYGQPQDQQPVQPTQPKPGYQDASTTMPNSNTTFCPICGSQNQKQAKFCSHCGADLK